MAHSNLLKIGIVGYGPAGIVAAISLSRNGHEVVMYEKESLEGLTEIAKTKTYPIDIGAKGLKAIDYLGAHQIF